MDSIILGLFAVLVIVYIVDGPHGMILDRILDVALVAGYLLITVGIVVGIGSIILQAVS